MRHAAFRTSRVARRAATAATVGVLVVGLAACGGGSSGGGGSSNGGGGGGGADAAHPVTITIEDWLYTPATAGSAGVGLKAVDDAFMKANPGIKIVHQLQPYDNYFALLQSQIAARKGPDIVGNFGRPSAFQYVKGFAPITDAIGDERAKVPLTSLMSANLSDKGTLYGVPSGVGGYIMYYNKGLLKKAGVTPEIPKTWDAFIAAMEKIKGAGIVPLVTGTKDGSYVEWLWENVAAQLMTEQQAADVPLGKYPLNGADMVKAMEMVKTLFDKGLVSPDYQDVAIFPELVNSFGAGKGAFFLGLLGQETAFGKSLGANFGGNGLFPRISGSQYPAQFLDSTPGTGYSVAKWSKNQNAAGKYLKYFVSVDAQKLLFDKSTSYPVNTDTKVTSTFPSTENILKWLKLPNGHNGPDANLPTPVSAVLSQNATAMMTGKTSIKSVLDQAQSAMQAYVKQYPVPTS